MATGYERLSMRRIAREIGISATSIYLHFASKDALFEELVDEGMERLHQDLRRARDASPSDHEAFGAMCRAYVRFGLDNPEYYEIMFVLRSREMSRFPMAKYRRARRNLDMMAQVIADAASLRVDDARLRATAVWMTLHGVVSLIVAQRIDVHIDQESVIDFILNRLESELPSVAAGVSSGKSHDSAGVSM